MQKYGRDGEAKLEDGVSESRSVQVVDGPRSDSRWLISVESKYTSLNGIEGEEVDDGWSERNDFKKSIEIDAHFISQYYLYVLFYGSREFVAFVVGADRKSFVASVNKDSRFKLF